MKSRGELLSEVDRVLGGIDRDLRIAQDIRLREKVDRLMESAAQGCDDIIGWYSGAQPDGVEYYDWNMSLHRSADIHANRLCPSMGCWDETTGRHLRCHDAYEETHSIGLNSYAYLENDDIPWTYCNADIFLDPVDDIEPPKYLDMEWMDDIVPLSPSNHGRTIAVDCSQSFIVMVDSLSSVQARLLNQIIEFNIGDPDA